MNSLPYTGKLGNECSQGIVGATVGKGRKEGKKEEKGRECGRGDEKTTNHLTTIPESKVY